MLNSCSDPSALHGLSWLLCYLTTGKHMMFYGSFGIVLILLAVTAPVALIFGFAASSVLAADAWGRARAAELIAARTTVGGA